MKQIFVLTCLILTTFVCKAQQIVLAYETDTVSVSMIPEQVGEKVSYDMVFDRVYQLQLQGYLLEEWTDTWVNGYTAYYYIREGYGYEWVQENISFDLIFQFTLIETEKFLYSMK